LVPIAGCRVSFRDQYARAKSGLTFISSSAWKLLIVARMQSQARIQRDRLRVYTRKRLAPKKYGDHIAHDVQGNTTLNFQPAVLVRVVGDGPASDVSPVPEAGSGVLLGGDGDIVRGSGGRR
jgi:hypothetical protein